MYSTKGKDEVFIMVKVREDLTGKTFGRLTVIKQADDYVNSQGTRYAQWLCQCSCGSEPKVVRQTSLRSGASTSCGCIQKEKVYDICCKENKPAIRGLHDEHGDYCIGFCSNTGAEFYFDESDYDLIYNGEHCWSEHINTRDGRHCVRSRERDSGGKYILLHQILGCKSYDHIDRNPMNNRRYNLRPATVTENSRNRGRYKNNKSGVTGVFWHKQSGKWASLIKVNKKPIYVGFFNDKEDAIKARLNAEVKYFGEFAPQKHLYNKYGITIQN